MSDKKKTTLTNTLKNSTSRLGLRALEPRILLDAAGFVTGADVAMDALDTQSVAEDMAALFEADSTTLAPRGELSQVETLLRDLYEVDADKELGAPAVIDDGGKDYGIKPFSPIVIDEGKNYDLMDDSDNVDLNFSTIKVSDPTFAPVDDGPIEIHSGETINVDLRANDIGDGELQGIIDPAAAETLTILEVNEPVTLESGLVVELLEDGSFNVTGPSNPTERSVSFDYVVTDAAGETQQATATFDWPEAPTIDLDVVDDPNVEPDEAAGIIPLDITTPVNIVTDADGNTTQATYRSVATVNGVTVDLVATLNSIEIIEPSTGGNQVSEFSFNTTPFSNDQNDPNFGELNANNRIPVSYTHLTLPTIYSV